jgi:mono/diheme cytochrome c family protein
MKRTLATLLLLAACGDGGNVELDVARFSAVELPPAVSPEMAARGARLFNQQTCFTCHGRDGAGAPLAPALDNQQWLNTDGSWESLVTVIRDGVPRPVHYPSPMPAMGGTRLTDDQIRDLAAYVYALSRGG